MSESEDIIEVITKKKNKKKKKRIEAIDEKSVDSYDQTNEDMIDYYLVVCLKQCLAASDEHVSIGDRDLWKQIYRKMKKNYRIKALNTIDCEIRFGDIFQKYLRVLRTSESLFSASLAFKCFDLLNDIDFEELSESKHRLVSQLRHKLMSSDSNDSNDCDESSQQEVIDIKTDDMIVKYIKQENP